MNCHWQSLDTNADGWTRYRCTRCNRKTGYTPDAADRVLATCKQQSPCIHRGDELRRQECDTCSGKQRIKIFACTLHGECSIGKQLDGIACCATCGDYRADEPPVL